MGRPTTSTQQSVKSSHDHDEGGVMLQSQINAAERIVYLAGEVSEALITQVIAGMISLATHDPKTPIKLIISTYGGSVDEMFALYDTMNYLPCPIHTIGLGKIMSAGVLLLASGEKGSRIIGENARIMMHATSGQSMGTFLQVKNETNEHERQQKQMEKLLLRESKMTQQQITAMMTSGNDTYVLPVDAIKFGLVDHVIQSNKK